MYPGVSGTEIGPKISSGTSFIARMDNSARGYLTTVVPVRARQAADCCENPSPGSRSGAVVLAPRTGLRSDGPQRRDRHATALARQARAVGGPSLEPKPAAMRLFD